MHQFHWLKGKKGKKVGERDIARRLGRRSAVAIFFLLLPIFLFSFLSLPHFFAFHFSKSFHMRDFGQNSIGKRVEVSH